MSTKFWTISALECIPQEGDMTDIVIVCHWRRGAKEVVNDKEYFGDTYGAASLPKPEGAFTPYSELTEAQVCGWLEQILDVASLDASLDAQIANQINPPVITPPLPWNPPTPVMENITLDVPVSPIEPSIIEPTI